MLAEGTLKVGEAEFEKRMETKVPQALADVLAETIDEWRWRIADSDSAIKSGQAEKRKKEFSIARMLDVISHRNEQALMAKMNKEGIEPSIPAEHSFRCGCGILTTRNFRAAYRRW